MFRLVFASLLLLLSFLVVLRAPLYSLWLTAVAVTGYPYWFMGLSFLSVLSGFYANRYKVPVLLFASIAFLLFSLPIINACISKQKVASGLDTVFPDTSQYARQVSAFSIKAMFAGIGIRKVAFKEIVYKTSGGQQLSFDFYPSYRKDASPVVIVIHGGSWEGGDSKQLPELNSFLANRGYHVAAINYRLSPAFRYPAPVEDTRSVVDYLVAHSAELLVDTTRFVLLGRSAGGQIALMAAYTLPYKSIRGVIGYYAPSDMVWGGQIKTNKLVLNTEKIYKGYLGGVYKQVPDMFKEASACEFVKEQSPPTLLIHGTIDPLVSYGHSERLSAKLAAHHVKHYFLSLPFASHGCDYNINSPAGQLSAFATAHFIHAVTQ